MTEQRGELQIKDLLIKLQVLTYALLEERKKSQSYLERIKEFQDSIQKKETEIVELTKTKFTLQSQLSLQLAKKSQNKKNDNYISAIFSKIRDKPVDQAYVTELEEKINQQNFEIKDLTQRLMEATENFDQQKIRFQTMITLQNVEMAKVQKELQAEKQKLIEEKNKPVIDTQSKAKLESLTNKYNKEKGEYESKIEKLNIELKEEKKFRDVAAKLKQELEEVKADCQMKIIENNAMKEQVSKLDKELAKAKVDIKDSKYLNERFFQVERIKDGLVKNKKVMTLVFRWVKGSQNEKGRCEVIFKRQKHGGTVGEDVVNLLDFNTFKINDKKKEYFDISFMVS